jgi:hypothetical protein
MTVKMGGFVVGVGWVSVGVWILEILEGYWRVVVGVFGGREVLGFGVTMGLGGKIFTGGWGGRDLFWICRLEGSCWECCQVCFGRNLRGRVFRVTRRNFRRCRSWAWASEEGGPRDCRKRPFRS